MVSSYSSHFVGALVWHNVNNKASEQRVRKAAREEFSEYPDFTYVTVYENGNWWVLADNTFTNKMDIYEVLADFELEFLCDN